MDIVDLERGLREVRDRLDIIDLFTRYCNAIDDGDVDAMVACFAPDAVFTNDLSGAIHGRDEFHRRMRGREHRPGSGRHFMLNPVIALDADRATYRVYSLITVVEDGRAVPRLTGEYNGSVVRRDGRWLFFERHYIQDHGAR